VSIRAKPTIATEKVMVTMFLTGAKLPILEIIPRECKFNQDSFLTFIAPELPNENARAKRRFDSKQLIVDLSNSMCTNGGKIQQNFARNKMTRVPHPVCSPNLSPCDFWLFGYAKEQMKNKTITSEDNLESGLTHVWEKASVNLLQSVFHEWMTRLEWVMELDGEGET
jgi:hypothetical protein